MANKFRVQDGIVFPDGTELTTGTNPLAPELTKVSGNLVSTTTLEFQGNMYGAIFDIDSGGDFDVWLQSVTGDDTGKSYAIGSNDDGYNFVYAFSASGTISWKVGLDDILSYDNTAYGIKYSSGYLYLSCQYYNNTAGENQLSVLKLNADDGTVNNSWILTNSNNVQYRPRDITVNSSGDPIVVGQSYNETQTYSGLTPQTGSGSQLLIVNASDLNNLAQTNPWGSYYVHTDPNDPNAWYQVANVNHFLNVPTVVLTGGGNGGLTVDIRYMYNTDVSAWVFDWVTITNAGSGYNDPDQVKVLGSSIGGIDGVDDIIMSRNSWYMNVLSVGGTAGNLCPSFVSNKIRFNTDQTVDYSTGTWDVRVGLGSQAFVWTPNWQHSYGDVSGQDIKSVNVDSSDNIYLLGDFEYYDGSNYHNVLAMKLNSSGVRQWSKYIEDDTNSSQDAGTIIPDSSGNCFIISKNDNSYTLVTKLDNTGALVWQVKQTDNNNWDNYAVGGLDSNGDVIVMGSWYNNNTNNDVTNIHKLSGADGSLVWSRDFSNQQDYDMYEYYDEDGQAGHVVGDNFYYGGYCYDSNDDQYVGFGFRLPTDGTGTGTYGRYVYSNNNDTDYTDNTSNAVLTDRTYNPVDSVSMTYVETSASVTVNAVGTTTSNHWFIGTGGGLTGIDSITFSDGSVQTVAYTGGSGSAISNGTSYANVTSSDGNVVIGVFNDNMNWTFATDRVLYGKTGEDITIGVIDTNSDGYQVRQLVTNGTDNLSRTQLTYDSFRIGLDFQGSDVAWNFGTSELSVPQDIDSSIRSYNGNIKISAMSAGQGGIAKLQSVSNINDPNVFTTIDATTTGANIKVYDGGSVTGTERTWQFDNNGTLTVPGDIFAEVGSDLAIQVFNPTAGGGVTYVVQNRQVDNDNDRTTQFEVAPANIILSTDFSGDRYQWIFDNTGNLILPTGGVITETSIPGGGLDGRTIALKPSGGTNSNQQLLVYPTGNPDYNHLHLTSGNLYSTELFLGNDNFYVKLANTGNIIINSNDNNGNVSQWRFNTDGSIYTIDELTLNVSDGIPTSLTKITSNQGWGAGSVGSNLPTTGGSGTGLTVDVADGGSAYSSIAIHTAGNGYTDGDIITVSNGGMIDTFTISVPGTKPWVFGMNGNLTLPEDGNILDSNNKPVIKIELPFDIKSTDFNAVAGGRYGVDTTSVAVTATLPASPSTGDAIYFADAGGAYSTNNLIVARNGHTIMGSASDMTVSIDNQSFGLFYNGTTWRVY